MAPKLITVGAESYSDRVRLLGRPTTWFLLTHFPGAASTRPSLPRHAPCSSGLSPRMFLEQVPLFARIQAAGTAQSLLLAPDASGRDRQEAWTGQRLHARKIDDAVWD